MGASGWVAFWELSTSTSAAYRGTDELFGPCFQRKQREAVCDRRTTARRVGALRYGGSPVSPLPLRNFCRSPRVFPRWAMGGLRQLSRWHSMAKQGGRNSKTATDLPAIHGALAPMVPGRKEHSLRWLQGRKS